MIILLAMLVSANADTLDLEIDGIDDSKKGALMIAVCGAKNTFPCNKNTAEAAKKITSFTKTAKVSFELPAGVYAVAAFHDENDDKKLNKNLFGIPTEGYALSGAKTTMPNFNDAKFNLNTHTSVKVDMRY